MDPPSSSPRFSRSTTISSAPVTINVDSSQNDPFRAKKVTVGFTPPSAAASTSYRSQIPGWSIEDNLQSNPAVTLLSKSPSGVSPLVEARKVDTAKSPTAAASHSASSGPAEKQLSKSEKKAMKQAKRAANKPASIPPPRDRQRQQSVKNSTEILNAPPKEKRATSAAPNARQGLKEVALFSHLEAGGKSSKAADILKADLLAKGVELHPAVLKLGLLYQHYSIIGSNDRCIAMLNTFRQVIRDYHTPSNTTLCRHLDSYLKPHINFLVSCRPMSVSMGNAIRFLKFEIAQLPHDMPEDDAKKYLEDKIMTYIRDRIVMADAIIADLGAKKINDGDVILTYSSSTLIRKIFIDAHVERGIKFRVIVVDSRPLLEGKKLLKDLVDAGLSCSYVHLNALSFVLKDASKVFIGAHALLSNGYVMSRVGTAMVSMMAHEMGIPVISCCETYKFSDRVQLDSFVNNELGDPEDLVNVGRYTLLQDTICTFKQFEDPGQKRINPSEQLLQKQGSQHSMSTGDSTLLKSGNVLQGWRDKPDLKVLHLMYDVTPSEFITLVITEVGLIPCSSVPVVLREGVKTAGASASAHIHNMSN